MRQSITRLSSAAVRACLPPEFRRLNLLSAIVFALLIATAPYNAVAAGGAVALVLDAQGEVTPAVSPYSKVDADTALTLGDSAKLRFAHLRKCAIVTVEGDGRLILSAESYAWTGLTPEATKTGACINRVTYVDPDQQPAGIHLRATRLPQLPSRPIFVLERTDRKAEYEIAIEPVSGDAEDVLLPVKEDVVAWPQGKEGLQKGLAYRLTLIKSGKRSAHSLAVLVPRGDGPSAEDAPLLLRFR